MRFSIFALATTASAWTFTAYNGQDCGGAHGSAVESKPPGQGVCSNVHNRASAMLTKLDSDTAQSLTLSYYGGNDCSGALRGKVTEGAGCYDFPAFTESVMIAANQ